jgi:SAM-dependent methyltransferase
MANTYCSNCGSTSGYEYVYPIDPSLEKTWQISTELTSLFNAREGSLCIDCGASIRAQGLAKAILDSKYGFGAKNLKEWVNKANKNKLKVCELNSCHKLHDTLIKLNNLTYSEYGTDSQQDVENLTYEDNIFDLVLHSETLEHVSNPGTAMDECRRVLKSDGIILFTVPVIWTRSTRQRAKIVNGKIEKTLPDSHHGFKTDDYLVFYEYGVDVGEIMRANLSVNDWRNQNYVFYSEKTPTNIPYITKATLKAQQRAAVLFRR